MVIRAPPKLNSYQEAHKIQPTELPSALEFYGFIFFFPSILAGPGIEFMDYHRYVHSANVTRTSPTWKSLILTTLIKLGMALMWAPLVVLQGSFAASYLSSSEWAASAFVRRLFDIWLYSLLVRSKYYFAWNFCEVGFVSAGYSYTPPEGFNTKENWDAARNVEPFAIEAPPEFSSIARKWNILTHFWIKNHVLFRLGRRTGAAGLSFLVSAFWHGFYPSYYVCFITLFVFIELDRFFIDAFMKQFQNRKDLVARLANTLHTAYLIWGLSYSGLTFVILNPSELWQFLCNSYFALYISFVLVFLIGFVSKKLQKHAEKKE